MDRGYLSRLRQTVSEREVRLVIAPAVLLEVGQNPSVVHRDAIVRAIADNQWRHGRLEPEIFLESIELINLVRLFRPSWLLSPSRPEATLRWHRLWTEEIYRKANQDPASVARGNAAVSEVHGDSSAAYHEAQKDNAERIRNSGLLGVFPEVFVSADPDGPTPKWWPTSSRIPAWSENAAGIWWHHLFESARYSSRSGARNTWRDWTEPFLDLDAIEADRANFYRLWCVEAIAAKAPRNWIRWALEFVQLGQSLKSSNAIDQQIGCYLFDCDVFLTADRRLHAALGTVRKVAPVTMAESRLIGANPDQFWNDISLALEF